MNVEQKEGEELQRKILTGVIVTVMIIILCIGDAFAAVSNIAGASENVNAASSRDTDVLNHLKDRYGYEGEYIPRQMKIEGKLKITPHPNATGGNGGYNVYFTPNNTSSSIALNNISAVNGVTMQDLKDKYGYPESRENYAVTWDGVIIVSIGEGTRDSQSNLVYTIDVNKLYTGADYTDGVNAEINTSEIETPAIDGLHDGQDNVQTAVQNVVDAWDFVASFLAHPVKGTLTLLLEVVRFIFGDAPQMLINLLETVPNGLRSPNVAFTYSVLSRTTARDGYLKISDSRKDNGDRDYAITIDNEGGEYKFSKNTKISFIPVDLYGMATGKIAVFDVNFLTGQNTKVDGKEVHSENSIWMTLRNFGTLIMRITLYVAAAFLLTTLIWHGIHVVRRSLGNPVAEAGHREGLKDFAVSVLMLVGTVIIMAVGIFGSKMLLENANDNTKEFPIRVSVMNGNNVIYNFSTNATGYVRYMSQTLNVEKFAEKAVYTFTYIILVWINVFGVVIMFVRFIGMLALSIIGPIIAALHAVHQEGVIRMKYSDWAKWYLILAMIQGIFAISYKIILQGAIL